MAVPKKRQSNTRRNKRRAQHDKAVVRMWVECPSCNEPKLPHRVCKSCGHYRGEAVLEVAEA